MNLKEQIDQELSNIILPESFNQKIYQNIRYRKKRKQKLILTVMLCVILIGGSVSAGYFYQTTHLNRTELPPLNPMEIKDVSESNAMPDENGFYEETYVSYKDLCDDLGITLLNSDLAKDNPYMIIKRKTNNKSWNIIEITAYIVGDLTNISLLPDIERYSWDRGDTFSSPIDMTIQIISSDTQLKNGFDLEYLGYYEYIETYTAKIGFPVNILQDTSIEENESSKVKPSYTAVFVYDGIRYIITGQMQLDSFK